MPRVYRPYGPDRRNDKALTPNTEKNATGPASREKEKTLDIKNMSGEKQIEDGGASPK